MPTTCFTSQLRPARRVAPDAPSSLSEDNRPHRQLQRPVQWLCRVRVVVTTYCTHQMPALAPLTLHRKHQLPEGTVVLKLHHLTNGLETCWRTRIFPVVDRETVSIRRRLGGGRLCKNSPKSLAFKQFQHSQICAFDFKRLVVCSMFGHLYGLKRSRNWIE